MAATSGVELAVGYISITAETSRIARDVRRALDEAEQDADRSGQRMGSGMAGGIGDQLKGLGALAIGGTIGAALMTGVSSAIEGEALGDKLSASLGATEADSQRYGAIAGKVFAGAYGENMGEVTSAIDAVASSLKGVGGIQLDDSGIQSATQKALDFASVYGTDVTESVQTVSQLVGNGLASSADEGFDLLVTAFQKVPAAMRDELPEILNEYGTNFSALGFDGKEAFNLLVGAAQQGKFALDKTGDALKEFTVLGSDMSKSSMEAYASVGLDAVAMSNAVATGGDAAQDAMQKTAAAILGIEDPATRANTAIALFGTPLEDLSIDQIPAFLESLSGATNGLGEVGGAADAMGATLADNASTKIEMFKRAVGQGLTNLAGNVIIPALGDAFTEIGNIFGPVITEVSGGITALVAAFQDGGDEVTSSGFAGFLEQIGITARNLYDGFNTTVLPMLKDFGEIAMNAGQAVLPVLWTAFQTGVDVVTSIITAISSVVGWFTQHKDVAIALGTVMGTFLAPIILTTTGSLIAQAAAWVANGIALGATAIGVAYYTTVSTIASAASKAWAATQWLLNAALTANPIGIVVLAIVALVAAIVLAYRNSETFRNIIKAAWEGIQTAVSVVWGFLQGIFASFMQGIRDIGTAATWLWNNAIMPAFNGIQTAISVVWTIIEGYFNLWKLAFTAIGDAAMWFYNNAILPAFDGVKAAAEFMWSGVTTIFGFFMDGLRVIGDVAMWLWNNAIKPAFEGVKTGAEFMWSGVMVIFDLFKAGLQGVGDFVSSIVGGIGAAWDGMKALLAKPVNFLINTVWNNGILKAWNAVADFLPGLEPAAPLAGIPEHRTGGAIGGPGGIDNVLMWGTRNEHMLTVDEVRKAGGHSAVYTIRDMIARGIPFSWDNGKLINDLGRSNVQAYGNNVRSVGVGKGKPEGMFDKILPGYKDGGAIEPWHKQLEAGHAFAKSKNGMPYIWGEWDCSAFMSRVADVILGGSGNKNWFTGSFPGSQPWVRGLGEGMSVGVHDNPGGPGGGHTAGTLSAAGPYGATNIESGGSHGNVAYGGPAAGADSSQWVGVSPGQFHLGIGANGFFQSGGAGGGSTGPSPAEQESFLQDKIDEVFDAIVAPIRSGITGAIGAPPPEYLGIPPKFLDTGTDLASQFLGDTVGGLGDALSSVWQGAQSLVGNLFDNGGVMPHGSIGVNMSGKPEAVLTNKEWSRLQGLSANLASGSASRPGNGLTESESRGGRNAPLIGSVNTTVDEQGLLGVIRRAQMFDERSLVG